MRFHFQAGPDVSELDLVPAVWTVGGGAADGVRIVGLVPALLQLAVEPGAVWLRGGRRLQVGRAPLDADIWRLLLPGESVELAPAGRLHLPSVPPLTTAGLLGACAAGSWPWPRSASAALVAVAGPDGGETFPLVGAKEQVGRAEDATVRLRDPAVSRRQLRMQREAAGHRLEPLPGPNPVRCNGRRLRKSRVLEEGDVLGVGQTLLVYQAALSPGETAQPAPPAAPSAGGAG
jgi:hypothetical protein